MIFPPPSSSKAGILLLRAAVLAAALGICAFAGAQLAPDAPVVDFRLPMFGDDGNLEWDLRGEEGRVVGQDQVDLAGMHLVIFDKNQPGRKEMEIFSPTATMFIPENQIRGTDSITVRGSNYVITGKRWLWDASEDRVVIDEDVKITFLEDLGNLLIVQ